MSGPRRWCRLFAAGLLAAAGAARAADDAIQPDRPGIADGSKVVGAGRFETETGVERDDVRDAGIRDRTTFAPTLLRLGIDDAWELRVESNVHAWTRERDAGGTVSHDSGWSPASIGVKYQFRDDRSGGPSLGAIARIFPPSGTGAFHNDRVTGDFRLAADWDFAPKFSLNPNIGIAADEDDDGDGFVAALFAATLQYSATDALGLFVDTGIEAPEAKHGRTSVIYDAGLIYAVGKTVQLDLSVGAGAAGRTSPHRLVSFGLSKRF